QRRGPRRPLDARGPPRQIVRDAPRLLRGLGRRALTRAFGSLRLRRLPRVVHAERERRARKPLDVLERDERRLRLRRGMTPDAVRAEARPGVGERKGVSALDPLWPFIAAGRILSPEPAVLRAGRVLDHHGPGRERLLQLVVALPLPA